MMNTGKWIQTWLLAAGTSMMGLAVGCNGDDHNTAAPPTAVEPPATTEHDGHDNHGHDEHGHAHKSRHGGRLVDLGGGDYHAEIVQNEETDTVTVHLLDGSAKNAVVIDASVLKINVAGAGEPRQYELRAVAADGGASEFQLADPDLSVSLHDKGVKARLTVSIAGKNYTGTVPTGEEHDHEHE